MRPILITGGAGFIGSHINKVLNLQGYPTVVLDSLENGYLDFVKWGKFYQGDIADCELLAKIVADEHPQAVIHLASYINVADSVADPHSYYLNNVIKSKVLIDFLVREQQLPIVFSSSAAVYGVPQFLPLTEDHPLQPISPYGKNKLEIENYLQQLPAVCLRYFNAAGADFAGQIGELHQPETHLIPLVLAAANGDCPQITIYGQDFQTKDGTCVRDYIHVMDLAQAHLLALEYLLAGGNGLTLNLANGAGYSNLQVVEMVKKVTGKDFPVSFASRRAGDPAYLIGDSQKARKVLGWAPQYDLQQIIGSAWQWYQLSRLKY